MIRTTRTLLLPLIAAGCAPVQTAGSRSRPVRSHHIRAPQLTRTIDSMVNAPEFRTRTGAC